MKKSLLTAICLLILKVVSAQNPYPVIMFDSAQFVNDTKLSQSPPVDIPDYVNPVKTNAQYGDTVRLEGYVLFDPRYYGLSATSRKSCMLMKDTISDKWQGIEVMCDPTAESTGRTLAQFIADNNFYDNLKQGYKVRVTGVMRSFVSGNANQTQVNMIKANTNWSNAVEVLDFTPHKVKPKVLSVDSITMGNPVTGIITNKLKSEKWEGTYVEIRNVSVYTRVKGISGNTNRWDWSVLDPSGNAISIRDYSGYFRNDATTADSILNLNTSRFAPPLIGTRFEYIRGVIQEYAVSGAARYGIAPLYPDDIGPISYTPPTVVNRGRYPVSPSSSDSVQFLYKFQRNSADISRANMYVSNTVDSTKYDSLPMSKLVVGIDTFWTAKAAPRAANSNVYYYVKAFDINNYSNTDTTGPAKVYRVIDGGITNIRQLQYSVPMLPANASIYNGDSALSGMAIRAVVTGTNLSSGTTINIATIQQGYGPNAAIIVNRLSGDATSNWKKGDSVLITGGLVTESFNMTALNKITASVISSGNPIPTPNTSIPLDTLIAWNSEINKINVKHALLNPWEGQAFRYDSSYVINPYPDAPSDHQEYSIADKSGEAMGLRVDDLSSQVTGYNTMLVPGQRTYKVQGILYQSFSNWKLNPTDSNDMKVDTIHPRVTITGQNPISIKKGSTFTNTAVVTYTDNAGIRSTSQWGTVDANTIGQYKLYYACMDQAFLTDTAILYVNVINKDTIKPSITLLGKNPDTLQRNHTYIDAGATAMDNVNGNITSRIVRSGSIDSSAVGTYTLTYTVSDDDGNTATAKRTVIVRYADGVNEQEMRGTEINVYPTPASSELNIAISNYKTTPVSVEIVDMHGRVVLNKQITQLNATVRLDVSTLNNGMYFARISNRNGSKTVKFEIAK